MTKQKKSDESVEDPFEALKKSLEKSGCHLVSGRDLETLQNLRRPFGIPSLDSEIAGGVGAGSITILYGNYGSGKTLFSMWCLREAQKKYGKDFKGLFLSLGLPLDKPYARIQGLKIPYNKSEKEEFVAFYTALHGAPPSKGEVAEAGESVGELDFLFADYSDDYSLEKVLKAFIALSATRRYQVAIVDDVGFLPSQALVNTAVDKDTRRGHFARVYGTFVQGLGKVLQYHKGSFNPASIILTVQSRTSDGPRKGTTLPFGLNLRFNTSTIIKLSKSLTDDGASQEISWRVIRGKYGHGEGATGVIPFNPYTGMNVTLDLAKTAVLNKVIDRAGPNFYLDGTAHKGYGALCAAIEEAGIQDKLLQEIKTKKQSALYHRTTE